MENEFYSVEIKFSDDSILTYKIRVNIEETLKEIIKTKLINKIIYVNIRTYIRDTIYSIDYL